MTVHISYNSVGGLSGVVQLSLRFIHAVIFSWQVSQLGAEQLGQRHFSFHMLFYLELNHDTMVSRQHNKKVKAETTTLCVPCSGNCKMSLLPNLMG